MHAVQRRIRRPNGRAWYCTSTRTSAEQIDPGRGQLYVYRLRRRRSEVRSPKGPVPIAGEAVSPSDSSSTSSIESSFSDAMPWLRLSAQLDFEPAESVECHHDCQPWSLGPLCCGLRSTCIRQSSSTYTVYPIMFANIYNRHV